VEILQCAYMKFNSLKQNKLFTVLRNLVIAEVVFYLVFLALALSADWGEIYKDSFLEQHIRFEVIEFLLLGLAQVGLIFFIFARSLNEEKSVDEIISFGEHEKLEFKKSFRWDINRGQTNKDLEKAVMKTVAAFLNSNGGHLLIGVDDHGNLTGIENDIASLPKSNTDGFENHFNNVFNIAIGPEFRRFVGLKFDKVGKNTVCLVKVEPSRKPVYLKTGDSEDFYIRTGNATTPLKMSEVATYISSWWRDK